MEYGLHIIAHHLGCIRVGAVTNYPHSGSRCGIVLPVVFAAKKNRRLCPTLFHPQFRLLGSVKETPERKTVVVLHLQDKFADRSIVRIAHNVDSSIVNLSADCKTEKKNLHHRHHEDDEHGSLVPENMEELLVYE